MESLTELKLAALCGDLKELCCVPIEQFLAARERTAHLDVDEMRSLLNFVCNCQAACGGGKPTPGPLEECHALLEKVSCSSSGTSTLNAIVTVLGPVVGAVPGDIIPTIPGLSPLKGLYDASQALLTVCTKGQALTGGQLAALCNAWNNMQAVLDQVSVIPGVSGLLDKVNNSELGAALKKCCLMAPASQGTAMQPLGGAGTTGLAPLPVKAGLGEKKGPTLAHQVGAYGGAAAAGYFLGPEAAPLGYAVGGAAGDVLDTFF